MLLDILLLLGAVPVAALLTRRAPRVSAPLLAALPLALFLRYALLTRPDAESVESWSWVGGLGVSLALRLDGLSLLFARLITGIGTIVVVYAGAYLRGDPRLPRFLAALFFFMASMLGVALADDAVLLFVFWELTSISSFLLIGYDHEREAARKAALQSLLVTGGGGLALMAGLLLLGSSGGTLRLSGLAQAGDAVRASALYRPALLLVLLGAFTKSAQVPFHFWLPGAMAAPSPVSAYLHSATMVKAGVYLLARLAPVLGGTDEWHYIVTLAGATTFVVGASMALGQSDSKRLLAFTTVSGLGLLVLLLGIGTEQAAVAAMAFLLVHALYKAALFMIAGTLDHETGTRDLERLSGLGRLMPLTALAAGVSALSMAGLPPMLGFIAKELVYEAKLEAPRAAAFITAAGLLASAMTVAAAAYVGVRPFLGPRRETPRAAHEAPPGLWSGPLLLALLSAAFGVLPEALATPIVAGAAAAVRGEHVPVSLALWHGINVPLLLSIATLAAGVALALGRRLLLRWAVLLGRLSAVGPQRLYDGGLAALLGLAKWQTRVLQSGALGTYLAITIATISVLCGWALLRHGLPEFSGARPVRAHEAAAGLAILASTVAVVLAKSRLQAIAALGGVGYATALVFLFFGGPDLAMTQFAVETLSVVLFVLAMRGMPELRLFSRAAERVRSAVIALLGGAVMGCLVLAASGPPHSTRLRDWVAQASLPLANGRNVVNVILVDFRALDTLGEITVLGIAALGVLALLKLRPAEEER